MYITWRKQLLRFANVSISAYTRTQTNLIYIGTTYNSCHLQTVVSVSHCITEVRTIRMRSLVIDYRYAYYSVSTTAFLYEVKNNVTQLIKRTNKYQRSLLIFTHLYTITPLLVTLGKGINRAQGKQRDHL